MFDAMFPDRLTWQYLPADNGVEILDDPGFDAPPAWVRALTAVARDLRFLRHGRDVRVDRLVWELSITEDYTVLVGWQKSGGIGGFGIGGNLSMDAAFPEAAVWTADVVQTELAGYEFVQWPSRGRHLLTPKVVDGAPAWADPHTGDVVAPIGGLDTGITDLPRT
ncbi:hypothetical protein [Prescottella subtropica]|uniref:hypothetical protein n=1 Tax=Prescottella subtropica TaxID=2545757 RepID=UPI001F4F1D85|nr:hypothetical protein [Prescottella subtropica]